MKNKWKVLIGVAVVAIVAIAQQPVKPVDALGSAMTTTQGGTAPASQLSVGGTYNTALPSLSNGQASQLQVDSSGRLITNIGTLPNVQPVPQSSSTYATPAFDLSATAATNVKASGGNVYGWFGFNPNSTTCYLQFYNSAAPTLGTSVLHPFGVVAGGSFNITPGSVAMFNLSTAISTGQTTTATGSSQCSSPMTITILYD